MHSQHFWRSVLVVTVFVILATAIFMQKSSFVAERRYVEPLRVARHRTAAMGSLETVLADIGVGRKEPYWASISIYTSLGMFPQMSGAIVDQDGRTVASVAVEFDFNDAQSAPDQAEVMVFISEADATALTAGKFGSFVRDGLKSAIKVESRFEIKRTIPLKLSNDLISSVAYRIYFGDVCYGLLHSAGKLVADDEWLNNYGTVPVFSAKGDRDMDLNLRWRLVGNENQLYVAQLKEIEGGKVEISVWPVPAKGVDHEEAVRTARNRWSKTKSPLALQAIENRENSEWRYDEKTGCMVSEWNRSYFYPDLSEDFR